MGSKLNYDFGYVKVGSGTGRSSVSFDVTHVEIVPVEPVWNGRPRLSEHTTPVLGWEQTPATPPTMDQILKPREN